MKHYGTLVLSGLGLNCEKETEYTCYQAGAKNVDVVHILSFLSGEIKLENYDFLIFIGGFLDGDHLGSSRVVANRFKYLPTAKKIQEDLIQFIEQQKLVLGICNGFQLLVKLGFLPDEKQLFTKQTISLTQNENARFEDRWVHLKINQQSPSVFVKGIDQLYLPIRHGEGQIIIDNSTTEKKLLTENLIVMQYTNPNGEIIPAYPYNPNGSWQNIAALTNQTGNIMGLMPHPEAYNHYTNHPHWTRLRKDQQEATGIKIFKNAYDYLR